MCTYTDELNMGFVTTVCLHADTTDEEEKRMRARGGVTVVFAVR